MLAAKYNKNLAGEIINKNTDFIELFSTKKLKCKSFSSLYKKTLL